MATVTPSSGGKAPVLDDDIYDVVCEDVIERTLEQPDQFGKTEKLEFRIKLIDVPDEDGEPVTLEPRCNKAWSERATLFKWALAFGIDADPTQTFDTDIFKGKRARADIRTEAEGKWPKVHDFLPMPKMRNGKAQAKTEEPDIDGFWKRVRGAGYAQRDVMLHLKLASMADLSAKINGFSQAELDKVADEMTGMDEDEVPFES